MGSGLRGWLVVPVVRQFWSNFSPPPPPTCLIVRACPGPRTTRTATHRKCVNAVACRLSGAKNGHATGRTSSTARRSVAGADRHQFNPLGRSNLLIRSQDKRRALVTSVDALPSHQRFFPVSSSHHKSQGEVTSLSSRSFVVTILVGKGASASVPDLSFLSRTRKASEPRK